MECIFRDDCYSICQSKVLYAGRHSTATTIRPISSDGQVFYRSIFESNGANVQFGIAIFYYESFQAAAIVESCIINRSHRVGDIDRSQAAATGESISADRRHRFGDIDRSQAAAKGESSVADRRHRVGDIDRSQAAAIVECIFADRSHRVGDIDRSQAAAKGECIGADSRQRIFYFSILRVRGKYKVATYFITRSI